MSKDSSPEKKLKLVSLQPKIIIAQPQATETEKLDNEEIILSPFLLDTADQVIENISELVDKVYEEFNQACAKKNLHWEAELELGMEFGVKFTAKLKISPK